VSLSFAEPLWPSPLVLEDDPSVVVARPVLSLTLYLGDPMPWAWDGARAVLSRFLQVVPVQDLKRFATSVRPGYHPVTGGDMAKVLHDLALPWSETKPRHLFWLRIVDDPETPGLAFSYREVDSRAQQRCGFLELVFPLFFDPDILLRFAQWIADSWPLLAGVGGYAVSWNLRQAATAMSAAFRWCRRYLCLDLADPEALSWHLPTALPGINWLTMIGRGHAATCKLDLDDLAKTAFTSPIAFHERIHAVVAQIGDAPVLGDLNQLAYPSGYAELARRLSRHLVTDPPAFYGDAWREEPDRTANYYRRFVDPESWR
jgi:hypothetical protein